MDKRFGFSIIAIGCIALAGVTASHKLSKRASLFGHAENDEYELVLGDGSAPASITSSYQNSVTGDVTTTNGNDVELSFVNAKTLSGGFVQLAPHGKIYNFGSTNDQLTGINGVSFTGSGSFTFKPAINKGILADLSPISVSAGSSKVALPTCDYFEIEAGDSGASISTLTFSYSCDDSAYDVRMLDGTYTGTGTDGYIYKVDITSGSVVVNSLDRESNIQLTGTMSMSSKTSASLAFNEFDAVANFAYDGDSLTYTTKSGADQNNFPDVSVKRVYHVEDFESFSATGDGYTSTRGATSNQSTTGLRSAFYSDYNGSNSVASSIGGSGWSLMGSSDFLNYNSSKGHNGTKTGIFKGNSNKLRDLSMNLFYGVPSVIGKGTTLSFWARGPWANTNYSTDASGNASITVYAFYQTPLGPSNLSACSSDTFVIPVGSGWTRYEMALDSSKTYYGYGFLCNQNATTYTAIDDIEIFTDSPYATYVAPYPEGTYHQTITVNSTSSSLVIAIGNQSNGLVSVMLSNSSLSATGITYNASTGAVTIATSGTYKIGNTNYNVGNITATYDATNHRLTGIGASGNIKNKITNNGSITANLVTESANTFYACDGTTAQLQSTFKRRYMSGSWQVDTSNTDRITSNTTQFVSGHGAVERRGYSGGAVALNLNSDFASAKTLQSIQFWVYNPSASDLTLRMWIYKAANLGSNAEIGSVTAKAGTWTYCAMGFTSAAIYNFQIADFNNSGAYLTFDNIYLL